MTYCLVLPRSEKIDQSGHRDNMKIGLLTSNFDHNIKWSHGCSIKKIYRVLNF